MGVFVFVGIGLVAGIDVVVGVDVPVLVGAGDFVVVGVGDFVGVGAVVDVVPDGPGGPVLLGGTADVGGRLVVVTVVVAAGLLVAADAEEAEAGGLVLGVVRGRGPVVAGVGCWGRSLGAGAWKRL